MQKIEQFYLSALCKVLGLFSYMFTEALTVNGPKQLGNIQVPNRACYIRVNLSELSCIGSQKGHVWNAH